MSSIFHLPPNSLPNPKNLSHTVPMLKGPTRPVTRAMTREVTPVDLKPSVSMKKELKDPPRRITRATARIIQAMASSHGKHHKRLELSLKKLKASGR